MSLLNFDIAFLRSYVAGIELGSFARAADKVGRSTSAVSAQYIAEVVVEQGIVGLLSERQF